MNKTSFPPERFLLVALLLFIGCTSGGNYSSTSNGSFNSERNKQIENGIELIDKAYHLIISEYYKPVSVSTMLFGSIKGIESLVGDTGCFIIEDGHPKIIHPLSHKIFDQKILDQKVTHHQGLKILKEIYSFIVKNRPDYTARKIAHAALDGMLQSLDPHSKLLPPEVVEDLQKDPKGKFTGIGIKIKMHDGFVIVISPIDDAPAEKAGIIAGDRIISVDGKPAKNLPQVIRMLQGPKGTKVLVSIMRAGQKKPIDFELVRDVIPIVSVKAINLAPGYSYVRLSQFSSTTTQKLEIALGKLEWSEGPMQGLILDLRNNDGGLFNQAIKVSDFFLEAGKIVTIRGLKKRNTKIYRATPNPIKRSYSMVVLINENSAAASEIVAGALQDHKRALILGTKSIGHGSIQTVEMLPDGSAFKLAIAICYTPSGRSIQTEAIEPDIVVKRKFVSENDYFYNDNPLFRKNEGEKPFSIERKLETDNQVRRALEILVQKNQLKLDV